MQCSRFHHVLGQLTGNCCAAEGDGNALGTVMRMWTERQIELRAAYNINLTSTALALILSSRHPALDEIQVWCCALAGSPVAVLPWQGAAIAFRQCCRLP